MEVMSNKELVFELKEMIKGCVEKHPGMITKRIITQEKSNKMIAALKRCQEIVLDLEYTGGVNLKPRQTSLFTEDLTKPTPTKGY